MTIHISSDNQNSEATALSLGNKCYNLFLMGQEGINIPPWVCLDASYISKILYLPQNKDIFEYIKMYLINKIGINDALPTIRRKIEEVYIPDECMAVIYQALSDNSMNAPFAIRSSSVWEDSHDLSGAGRYETILNVGIAELKKSILKCYASVYCKETFIETKIEPHTDYLPMPIMIQEMIQSKKSGIAFTASPVSSSHSNILIECGEGLGDRVVSGEEEISCYSFSRINKTVEQTSSGSATLDEREIMSLVALCDEIEHILGADQDIEWAIGEHGLHILQARPITTIKRRTLDRVRYFPIYELGEDTRHYLEEHNSRYDRLMRKKVPFYRACIDTGVSCCNWYFIHYTASLLTDGLIDEFKKKFTTPHVYINVNENLMDMHSTVEEMGIVLKDIGNIMRDQPLTLCIREDYKNDMSVISSLNEDGDIYIEYAFGMLSGILSGAVVPSYAIVSKEGIIKKHIKASDHKQYVRLDEIENRQVLDINYHDMELSAADLVRIAHDTIKLTHELGVNLAIEWWKGDNFLVASDVSFVGQPILSEPPISEIAIISSGIIEGVVLRVDSFDSDIAFYLSHGRGISVMDHDDNMQNFHWIHEIKKTIAQYKSDGSKVLLYFNKPLLIFSLFIDDVDGFIFKSASMLCHFSIILREKGVPAISLLGKELKIANGDNFSYS